MQVNILKHFHWIFQDREHTNLVCVYPRGAGKSYAALDWCMQRILTDEDPNASAMIITNDLKKGKVTTRKPLTRYEEFVQRGVLRYNENTGNIILKETNQKSLHQKTIYLGSYNQKETLRGYHVKYIVLDEARDMPIQVYQEVIVPIVEGLETGGQFLIIGTPRGTNNILYQLYQEGQTDNPVTKSKLLTGVDLQYSQKRMNFYRGTLSPAIFRQEIMCDPSVDVVFGDIYADLIEKMKVNNFISDDIKYNPALPINLAFDLGYNDATAIWFWQLDGNDINVIDYREYRKLYFPEIIKQLNAIPLYALNSFKYCILPHDSVNHHISGGGNLQAKTIQNTKTFDANTVYGMARMQGWEAYIVPRTSSVADSVFPCREFLRRCRFNATQCDLGIKRLMTYKYDLKHSKDPNKEGELEVTNIPEEYGDHIHGCDSFRYMAMSEDIWHTKKLSKPLPGQRSSIQQWSIQNLSEYYS